MSRGTAVYLLSSLRLSTLLKWEIAALILGHEPATYSMDPLDT